MKFPALRLRSQATISPEVLEAQAALLRAQQTANKVIAPEAPPVKQSPPPPPKKVDMGPYEKVIIFDTGPQEGKGVTWMTMLPRRLLMEHLDIETRRLKQPFRFRRLVGILVGIVIGLVGGSLGRLIMVIAGVFGSALFGILICLIIGAVLGAIPGWFIGPLLFGTYPMWFVRKNGEVITPVLHKGFDKARYTGQMKWHKEEDGSIRLEVPPGIMAQSAVFLYHAIRSKDLIDMWRSVSGRMEKLKTAALVVIAVCSLVIMFLVGYTTLSGGSGKSSPSTPTPIGGSNATR